MVEPPDQKWSGGFHLKLKYTPITMKIISATRLDLQKAYTLALLAFADFEDSVHNECQSHNLIIPPEAVADFWRAAEIKTGGKLSDADIVRGFTQAVTRWAQEEGIDISPLPTTRLEICTLVSQAEKLRMFESIE